MIAEILNKEFNLLFVRKEQKASKTVRWFIASKTNLTGPDNVQENADRKAHKESFQAGLVKCLAISQYVR